ncbi:MAG: hypothetical protein OXH34_01725 [Bacteroidetes bacterium]|nr:hypothetical protein [Bacteroidota bacterium]
MNIVFDLDGTLADIRHRLHFIENQPKDWDAFFAACDKDDLIPVTAQIFEALLHMQDNAIEIWTGRSAGKDGEIREMTIEWLENYVCHPYGCVGDEKTFFDEFEITLRMRSHEDYRQDPELKREWLNQARASGHEVHLVFEDRDRVVKMWRDEGVQCCQVAAGDF